MFERNGVHMLSGTAAALYIRPRRIRLPAWWSRPLSPCIGRAALHRLVR